MYRFFPSRIRIEFGVLPDPSFVLDSLVAKGLKLSKMTLWLGVVDPSDSYRSAVCKKSCGRGGEVRCNGGRRKERQCMGCLPTSGKNLLLALQVGCVPIHTPVFQLSAPLTSDERREKC